MCPFYKFAFVVWAGLVMVAAVASLLNCSVKLSGVFMFSGGAWLTPEHYYLLLSLLFKVSNRLLKFRSLSETLKPLFVLNVVDHISGVVSLEIYFAGFKRYDLNNRSISF